MFEEFRKQFLTLNDDNKKALIKELSLTFYENDHTDRPLNNCPHCKSDQISKYGKYNGHNVTNAVHVTVPLSLRQAPQSV